MLDKDSAKRPTILQVFELLELKQEVNKLIAEYPELYRGFEPLQFGKKKIKLELEIHENHQPLETKKLLITPIEKLTRKN